MALHFNSKLRLDKQQKMALEIALEHLETEIYLFGSRTNPDSKGGDVDVFVLNDGNQEENYILQKKIIRKYQQICDERIDVIVLPLVHSMEYAQRVFFESTEKVCLTS